MINTSSPLESRVLDSDARWSFAVSVYYTLEGIEVTLHFSLRNLADNLRTTGILQSVKFRNMIRM